jgi:nitrate reductase NapAB chaperone NapD
MMQNRGPDDIIVVASLVVHARPEHAREVRKDVCSLHGASVVMAHENKFAVVLETESTESAADMTERIRTMNGVTSVELVAHFFEEEVQGNLEAFD